MVPWHSLKDSHALQESGCFKGKAKPLSIAASLMMGSFTTTQSLSWKEVKHVTRRSCQQEQSSCSLQPHCQDLCPGYHTGTAASCL